MLVIERLTNESLVIFAGQQRIVVRVASVRGRRVRLAVAAPPDVKLLRAELEGQQPRERSVEPAA